MSARVGLRRAVLRSRPVVVTIEGFIEAHFAPEILPDLVAGDNLKIGDRYAPGLSFCLDMAGDAACEPAPAKFSMRGEFEEAEILIRLHPHAAGDNLLAAQNADGMDRHFNQIQHLTKNLLLCLILTGECGDAPQPEFRFRIIADEIFPAIGRKRF